MKATVLGGRGFVGSALAGSLLRDGVECWVPQRGDDGIFERELGVLFYCVGITADFRRRPLDTVEAHVSFLQRLLERARFQRLIYLSSTRVYKRAARADEEEPLSVLSSDPDDLYDLSKLMGECLALSAGRSCSVARLSNVVGPGMGSTNFLGAVVAEAKAEGRVAIWSNPGSAKDYIWIDDVVAGLRAIAENGTSPVYNLATGENCSNAQIASLLSEAGVEVAMDDNAPAVVFPPVSIRKLVQETGFAPRSVLPLLASWIESEVRR